jgi:uncharacterized protein YwgA
MKRIQKAVLLTELLHELRNRGSWAGETHLQKATYFLINLFQAPLGYEFVLYKHGPFSFELRDAITDFRADGLMVWQPMPAPYGPRLKPTALAREYADRFPNTIQKYRKKMEFIAGELGGKKVTELERLATALHVSLDDNGLEEEEIAVKISELKPHVSLENARLAAKNLASIRQGALSILNDAK